MSVLFISIGWMPFLAPTHDNVDPLFAPDLYHVEVTDHDPASGSL